VEADLATLGTEERGKKLQNKRAVVSERDVSKEKSGRGFGPSRGRLVMPLRSRSHGRSRRGQD
jgi:hypothetical protein